MSPRRELGQFLPLVPVQRVSDHPGTPVPTGNSMDVPIWRQLEILQQQVVASGWTTGCSEFLRNGSVGALDV